MGDALDRLLIWKIHYGFAHTNARSRHLRALIDESSRRLLVGNSFRPGAGQPRRRLSRRILALLQAHPAVLEELGELLPLLDDLSERVTYPLDDELKWEHRVPLSVHARHTLDDALTAFGLLDIGKKLYKQTGVFRHEATNSELFFVTLEKSERDYSPSTLYKDYAISPLLFHWESQSGTTQASQPDKGTSITENGAVISCCLSGRGKTKMAGRCLIHFSGRWTTNRTKEIARSALCGS